MSSKKVSVFLVSHGSIDAKFERKIKDPHSEVDIYHFGISCQELPGNVTFYMPNILGKPYYENRDNMIKFIERKINKWNPHPPDAGRRGRKRSRSPEPGSSFSDFIAASLTRFEQRETAKMFDLMDKCVERDRVGYEKGATMSIQQKQERRDMSKATMQKNGIKWEELGCYIPEKHYILTGRPGEDVLVVIEQIGDDGVSTVFDVVKPTLTPGRKNLAQVNDELSSKLKDTNEICFFDFACSTFNFKGIPALEPYWPNLLSYQRNGDDGATMIYGTISKDQCERMNHAETDGHKGVSFDESPKSPLSLGSQSDSLSQSSQSSLAASPPPLLHVRVPIKAKSTIDFGSVVFRAGPGPGPGSRGGKRKYTKRTRNLKKSYRKRRVVTRRRYNTRRYSKMNR
jgi:hypothetical protein